MLDVADTHANDRAYFAAIDDELHRDGGLAGLMHVLQTFDLGSVDVYAPPKTAALLEQKEKSFPPHVQWWAETLNRGTLRYPINERRSGHTNRNQRLAGEHPQVAGLGSLCLVDAAAQHP